MITVLKGSAAPEQRENLIRWLKGQNVDVHISEGSEYTVLGLVGDTAHIDVELLDPAQAEAPEGDTTVMVIAPKIDPYNTEKTTQTIDFLGKLAKRTYKTAKVWIHTNFDNMPKALGIQPRKENEIKYGNEANKLSSY